MMVGQLLRMENLLFMARGLWVTVQIAAASIILSTICGTILGVVRSSKHRLFARLAGVYIIAETDTFGNRGHDDLYRRGDRRDCPGRIEFHRQGAMGGCAVSGLFISENTAPYHSSPGAAQYDSASGLAVYYRGKGHLLRMGGRDRGVDRERDDPDGTVRFQISGFYDLFPDCLHLFCDELCIVDAGPDATAQADPSRPLKFLR